MLYMTLLCYSMANHRTWVCLLGHS